MRRKDDKAFIYIPFDRSQRELIVKDRPYQIKMMNEKAGRRWKLAEGPAPISR